jgi:ABC-type dipeptide/oligopeptide/nickel transport system permease subunit
VLHTDRFGQSLIELLLIAGAVAALLALGANWVGAAVFGVIAAVIGYFGSTGK